jgi:hypothetical protein
VDYGQLHVYAMCGVAFSGKSTLALRSAGELSICLISLDAIKHERGLRGGEGMSIAQWKRRARLQWTGCANTSGRASPRWSMTRSPAASCATDAKLWRLEFGAEFTIVFVDTAIDEIGSRRDANNQRPTRHHVRDDIFEDRYKTVLFPTAEEPFVRVVEGFDLQSWLTEEAARV